MSVIFIVCRRGDYKTFGNILMVQSIQMVQLMLGKKRDWMPFKLVEKKSKHSQLITMHQYCYWCIPLGVFINVTDVARIFDGLEFIILAPNSDEKSTLVLAAMVRQAIQGEVIPFTDSLY